MNRQHIVLLPSLTMTQGERNILRLAQVELETKLTQVWTLTMWMYCRCCCLTTTTSAGLRKSTKSLVGRERRDRCSRKHAHFRLLPEGQSLWNRDSRVGEVIVRRVSRQNHSQNCPHCPSSVCRSVREEPVAVATWPRSSGGARNCGSSPHPPR